MAQMRKAEIRSRKRLLDDFFKVDELVVTHQRRDGTMSGEQRRLVFERGDAAAVLLFNTDRRCVVLVEQFRAPTLEKSDSGGWLTETVAGMVEPGEAPEATAIRETFEETGYRIGAPKLIAKFFSSPGGTSERVFLYYAPVRDSDKTGDGDGEEGPDIEVREIPLGVLIEKLRSGGIEDPKLLIGALWLERNV